MTDEHPTTELARELVALMDKTELTMAEGRRIFVLRDSYAIVIARRLLALEAVVEAAHEAATPKPIDTAPKDGTKILLLKIAGHPAHPTALWWCALGFWSSRWNNWNDGVEPAGLADPNYWMPAPSLAALDKLKEG